MLRIDLDNERVDLVPLHTITGSIEIRPLADVPQAVNTSA